MAEKNGENFFLCQKIGSLNEKNSSTKAVIIAAGNGSRLCGYQNGSPKPLVKVGGMPLLQRVILSTKKIGISEFVIVGREQ